MQAAQHQAALCTACPLCENRGQSVWGRGPTKAEYMFIGEAPSVADDQAATPFSGREGAMLNDWILQAGLQDVYFTSTVKCRTPMGRAPFMAEMDTCFKYLQAQLQAVKPRALILLGKAPVELLHPWEGTNKPLRYFTNHIVESGGYFFLAAYSPRFILRQPTEIQQDMVAALMPALRDLKRQVEAEQGG